MKSYKSNSNLKLKLVLDRNDNMKTQIKGSVRHLIYQSPTGFVVGLFKVKETKPEVALILNRTLTFTGTFPETLNKDDYLFWGEFVKHPQYGKQFQVETYERVIPTAKSGIISFLSSSLFKGIGIKTATKIVDTLGDKVLDLIVADYTCLLKVPKITKEKAEMIKQVLEKEVVSYKIIIELQELGFTMKEATKIYNIYQSETLSIIKSNIYQLMFEVNGISFVNLDRIALQQKVEPTSEERVIACLIYQMRELCFKEGNIYLEKDVILKAVTKYLNFTITNDKFTYYLHSLNEKQQLIIEEERYYLKEFYNTETDNAYRLVALMKQKPKELPQLDGLIKELKLAVKYNKEQMEALKGSLINSLFIITGGPGTGKTTIIAALVTLYQKLYGRETATAELALLAPTGRAARKMSLVTNFPATTIHRFLKWNKDTNEFGVNAQNKARVDFVIIDEASMIDNFLLYHLLQALTEDIQLILIGDYHQLPSVGPGQVLLDLIKTKQVPLIELKELYRQQEDSYILNLAYEIKAGTLTKEWLIKKEDYNFIECPRYQIKEIISLLCQKALVKGYKKEEIQVIAPMYRGLNGIDNLNHTLQTIFNPDQKEQAILKTATFNYREGDKVLQTKNNLDQNVANGDLGIINHIDSKRGKVVIDFNQELVTYNLKEFSEVTLGYAISIHKAQGSEFDLIIIPLDLAFSRMLYRKLIYTAVTRAKKALMLVGEQGAFIKSVDNDYEASRQTTLKTRINNLLNNE